MYSDWPKIIQKFSVWLNVYLGRLSYYKKRYYKNNVYLFVLTKKKSFTYLPYVDFIFLIFNFIFCENPLSILVSVFVDVFNSGRANPEQFK